MANYSFSRNERLYLETQAAFGTINNTGGTADLAGGDACRFIRVGLMNDVDLLERPDKTGTRSMEGMVGGRKIASWDVEMSLVGNGTAGAAPDCDPLLKAAFGSVTDNSSASGVSISASTDAEPIVCTSTTHGLTIGNVYYGTVDGHTTNTNANGVWAAYVNTADTFTLIGSSGNGAGAGASGTFTPKNQLYSLDDEIDYLTIWSFRTPAALDQRVIHTAVVNEIAFNLGQDVSTWSANGSGMWVLTSKSFASADSYQKAGLSAFPSEPATPVTNGGIIPGFVGNFGGGPASTIGTVSYHYDTVRTAAIRMVTSNAIVRDTFGSYYGTLTEGDVRSVTLTFDIYDDDSTKVQALKAAGESKTPWRIPISIGTTAGAGFVLDLNNIYLSSHDLGDGQLRFNAAFGDSRATTTSLDVTDEFMLAAV